MKNKKILIPILSIGALTSVVAPLSTLTSCGKKLGNLMTEYTPTIAAPEYKEAFATPHDVVVQYLKECYDNPEIFRQDLLYTLSRGMPQYNAYMSEFCEISDADYDATIDKIQVNKNDETVSFELTMKIHFDYSKTKKYELEWYDLNYQIWDSVTTAKFVFDFKTTTFDAFDARGQRRQMTTYAGATQLGISEFRSTTQLIKQTGKGINLEGNEVDLGQSGGDLCHFILPTYDYYEKEGQTETYYKNYTEAWKLWLDYWGIQAPVLSFKYYMPSNNVLASDDTPRALDFGSYHMQYARLKDLYTYGKSTQTSYVDNPEKTIMGFNLSHDSSRNWTNIQSDIGWDAANKALTLGNQSGLITNVAPHAFDGVFSEYTNLGIPNEVEALVIPGSYSDFGDYAFTSSFGLKKLIFEQTGDNVVAFHDHSFDTLPNVEEIDFSKMGKTKSGMLTQMGGIGASAFADIHLGVETQVGVKEGDIIIPVGADEETWKAQLKTLGFKLVEEEQASGKPGGWYVHTADKP